MEEVWNETYGQMTVPRLGNQSMFAALSISCVNDLNKSAMAMGQGAVQITRTGRTSLLRLRN